MNIHGYELTSEWANSTCGKTARAKKGGKRFFLKKYQTPVAPIDNGTLDKKTFAHNKKLFEEFVALRKEVNNAIRPLAGAGGNIIIPSAEFIDGNNYVEASEFVDGVVSKEELVTVLSSLSDDTIKLLMKTAAGALSSVHGKKIVHSDLKLDNVLLVRNSAGNYVAKLIDFDSSFPVNRKPEEIIGTIDYYSPELGAYVDAEDEREEMEKYITEKTDIFSLGLIFHFYLAGCFPEAINLTERLQKWKDKGRTIYPWIALNSGCSLQLSPKIKGAKYISLITDMLSKAPEDRPTASDVLKRLQAPDTATKAVLQEPWPEHSIAFDRAKLEAAGVTKLEKVLDGSKNKYKLTFAGSRDKVMAKEELISKGYAKEVVIAGSDGAWEEHNIEFDMDMLKSRGFVRVGRATVSGVKGYNLYRMNGQSVFVKSEMMVAMKYAKKKTARKSEVITEVGMAEPWAEHNIEFDTDVIKAKGYKGFERKSMGGVNGYEFVRSDGARQFIRVEMVIIQRMARKL